MTAPTPQLVRPAWKRSIGGIPYAVGYRDSAGEIVIVANWSQLLYKRREKVNVSAPGYGRVSEGMEDEGE